MKRRFAVFDFLRRRKKRVCRRPPDTSSTIHPTVGVERPACPPEPDACRSDHTDDQQTRHDDGNGHSGQVNDASLAELLSAHLATCIEQQFHDLAAQLEEHFQVGQAALEQHINILTGGIGDTLTQQVAQQGADLQETVERNASSLADQIAAAVGENAEKHASALRKEVTEACSAEARRAMQRPIIDRLIVLLDRIRDDGEFLTARYRKDPNLPLHLGCREVQEGYDAALRSYVAEIHMVLRGLGVEQIEGCSGPFNPKHQEVVGVEMVSNPDLDGHVAKIVRAGFTWDGTILRAERIVVFKMERMNHG